MDQLQKYYLNKIKTLDYTKTHLDKCNALCNSVLQKVPFDKGEFFTFLPSETSEEQLHQFKWGGVLKGGQKEFISDWLYRETIASKRSTCVFDEYDARYAEEKTSKLFNSFGAHNKEEVFYILNTEVQDRDVFLKCLYESDVIWHSLTVVSSYQYKRAQDKKISMGEMNSIVKDTQIILLLAYDGEGYIIWERNPI